MEFDVRRPVYSSCTAWTLTLVGILNVSKLSSRSVKVSPDPNRSERVYLDMLS